MTRTPAAVPPFPEKMEGEPSVNQASTGGHYQTTPIVARLRAFIQDWRTVTLFRRHGYELRQSEKLLIRLSDQTLWMAGHPGWRRPGYHFLRVRKWRGVLIAHRRFFWSHRDDNAFAIVGDYPMYVCGLA